MVVTEGKPPSPIQSSLHRPTVLFAVGKGSKESGDYNWLHVFPFSVVRPDL